MQQHSKKTENSRQTKFVLIKILISFIKESPMEKSIDEILAICSIFSIFFNVYHSWWHHQLWNTGWTASPLATSGDMSQTIYEYLINLKADSPLEMPDCFWPSGAERLKDLFLLLIHLNSVTNTSDNQKE